VLSVVRDFWIHSTTLIINELGGRGTGFLVGDKVDKRIFVVTNKHVINKDKSKRDNATRLTLYFNMEKEQQGTTRRDIEVSLNLEGKKPWREHPDKDVDLLVFNITELLKSKEVPLLKSRAVLYDYFLTKELMERMDIKIADEILIIGYPDMFGLRHQTSNLPIVRQGIIASNIGENLEDWGLNYKESERRILRAFLIDGAIIPGSSGSPVILKPTLGRNVKDKYLVEKFPSILLGMVSEMRYGIITDSISDFKSFANLGLVCNADTIKETIELFDQR
jgi:Trypsin-like peptidase domain